MAIPKSQRVIFDPGDWNSFLENGYHFDDLMDTVVSILIIPFQTAYFDSLNMKKHITQLMSTWYATPPAQRAIRWLFENHILLMRFNPI